jgi:hypothetical protein
MLHYSREPWMLLEPLLVLLFVDLTDVIVRQTWNKNASTWISEKFYHCMHVMPPYFLFCWLERKKEEEEADIWRFQSIVFQFLHSVVPLVSFIYIIQLSIHKYNNVI